MHREWHSSPVRNFSSDLGSLHAIEARQKARADRLYQPLSSPTREGSDNYQRQQLRDQMRRMRDDIRDRKKELMREKTIDVEDRDARLKQLQNEAEALDFDLDILLEEEEIVRKDFIEVRASSQGSSIDFEPSNCQKPSSTLLDTRYIMELEDELEDLLAAEELELEEQLRDLQL